MKKLLTLSAVALSISAVAHASEQKQIVQIQGQVHAQTCKLDGLPIQQVQLPKVTLTELKAGTSPAQSFEVKFKECENNTPVYVAFDQQSPNISDNGNLINRDKTAFSAKGVQIAILKDDKVMNLKQTVSSDVIKSPMVDGRVTFAFKANYAVDPAVEPTTGYVNTSIPVVLKYN